MQKTNLTIHTTKCRVIAANPTWTGKLLTTMNLLITNKPLASYNFNNLTVFSPHSHRVEQILNARTNFSKAEIHKFLEAAKHTHTINCSISVDVFASQRKTAGGTEVVHKQQHWSKNKALMSILHRVVGMFPMQLLHKCIVQFIVEK